MEPLGKGLGETVGDRLGHDRRVIVVIAIVRPAELLAAVAGRAGEGSEIVLASALDGGHEVGQRMEGVLPLPLPLLAQRVHPAHLGRSRIVGIQNDVVTGGVGREESVDALGDEGVGADDFVEHP